MYIQKHKYQDNEPSCIKNSIMNASPSFSNALALYTLLLYIHSTHLTPTASILKQIVIHLKLFQYVSLKRGTF